MFEYVYVHTYIITVCVCVCACVARVLQSNTYRSSAARCSSDHTAAAAESWSSTELTLKAQVLEALNKSTNKCDYLTTR